MGAKDSKRLCLPYEEAIKRLSEAELKRICETFKRLTNGHSSTTPTSSTSSSSFCSPHSPGLLLSRSLFRQHVLGDGVPPTIADWLYTACGGTGRGISMRDVICGVALLMRATTDERIQFLWQLYSNEAGTAIHRADFEAAMRVEGVTSPEHIVNSLFGAGRPFATTATCSTSAAAGSGRATTNENAAMMGRRLLVTCDEFRAWLLYDPHVTVLSRWLLVVSSGDVATTTVVPPTGFAGDTPTFYQTLAGVTHLEEADIGDLEKGFWCLQQASTSGVLDAACVRAIVSPPLPPDLVDGFFLALDVNRDGHVDFKELCCGISAACRGPTAERLKFLFRIFDADGDAHLNATEWHHLLVHTVPHQPPPMAVSRSSDTNNNTNDNRCHQLSSVSGMNQGDFLVWCMEEGNAARVEPLLKLLFDICHVSLGLRPFCRHHEYEIVNEWLHREQQQNGGSRPLSTTGQFWYLVAADWWQHWLNYTTGVRTTPLVVDHCQCADVKLPGIEEAVCISDDSLLSTTSTTSGGSTALIPTTPIIAATSSRQNGCKLTPDNCSIASSSGVSTSSSLGVGGGVTVAAQRRPGPIDNRSLITSSSYKVPSLTGEGGRLRRDNLVQHRDYELLPDALWRAMAHWYGASLPLPRQVIKAAASGVELELFPLQLRILRHHPNNNNNNNNNSNNTFTVNNNNNNSSSTQCRGGSLMAPPLRRHLVYTATFSRLATVRHLLEFLCNRLSLSSVEEARLWHVKSDACCVLLEAETEEEEENSGGGGGAPTTLQDVGVVDGDQLLLEVRNKDLTWPEEMGALAMETCMTSQQQQQRRPTVCLPPGATGLHNLGNTCFMNAALQAVSNTRPLTQYFRGGEFGAELNSANPLGTKGAVARGYADLCRQLWAGATRSIAPVKLRACLQRHAPHLGGGGQHDSQELLAWLLDALHEDLNRVDRRKPQNYVELKDSGGRPDEAVAQEAWLHHLQRDHSIVTDLFYGQLKSKVTCETCSHESVRFDPFNLLSLPLPMDSYHLCEVIVVRMRDSSDAHPAPKKYAVRLSSDAKYGELKERLTALIGLPADQRLLLAVVVQSRVERLLADAARITANCTTNLYAYQISDDGLPDTVDTSMTATATNSCSVASDEFDSGCVDDVSMTNHVVDTPLAHSPEVRSGSALCMPNILCFKTKTKMVDYILGGDNSDLQQNSHTSAAAIYHRPSVFSTASKTPSTTNLLQMRKVNCGATSDSGSSTTSSSSRNSTNDNNNQMRQELFNSKSNQFGKQSRHLVAVHRKHMRQDVYFLPAQKCRPQLFGTPLIVSCQRYTTCQQVYETVWQQVTRLLSPLPQSDNHLNHATDCDDSLGYEFPFTLKAVQGNGDVCAICHWTEFCRGCTLPCSATEPVLNYYRCVEAVDGAAVADNTFVQQVPVSIAIDWDPTALHLRYQTNREKMCLEDESVAICRRQHTEPIDLDYCLRAFTTEERLEAKYHCSACDSKQPATKKLQIWRLPPILIVHLKRFDYAHGKWMKTQKLVNFPFRRFNPTAYLASVPQETIWRHQQQQQEQQTVAMTTTDQFLSSLDGATSEKSPHSRRSRLVSTSLLRSPIVDDKLVDYHGHHLQTGRDAFDLAYDLYAVVSHSGLLNGGHYVAHACNPNGNWYCYNDSSCREVYNINSKKLSTLSTVNDNCDSTSSCVPKIDTSAAYILFYERVGLDYRPYLPPRNSHEIVTADNKLQCPVIESAVVTDNTHNSETSLTRLNGTTTSDSNEQLLRNNKQLSCLLQ